MQAWPSLGSFQKFSEPFRKDVLFKQVRPGPTPSMLGSPERRLPPPTPHARQGSSLTLPDAVGTKDRRCPPAWGFGTCDGRRSSRCISAITCSLAGVSIFPLPAGTEPPEFGCRKGSGLAQNGPKGSRGARGTAARGHELAQPRPSPELVACSSKAEGRSAPSGRSSECPRGTPGPREWPRQAAGHGAHAARQGEAGRRLYCTR